MSKEICSQCTGSGETVHQSEREGDIENRQCSGCLGSGFKRSKLTLASVSRAQETKSEFALEKAVQAVIDRYPVK